MAAPKYPNRCRFNQEVKHQRSRFFEGDVIEFEDPDAAPYFVRCKWAEFSEEEPRYVVTKDELDIDPETIEGGTGLLVKDVKIEGNF